MTWNWESRAEQVPISPSLLCLVGKCLDRWLFANMDTQRNLLGYNLLGYNIPNIILNQMDQIIGIPT